VRGLFFTTAGGLRAFWRLLLFVLAMFACTLVAGALLGPLLAGGFNVAGLRGQTIAEVVALAGALAATWHCLRQVEKKPWRDVGLHAAAAAPSKIGLGLTVGSGAIALPIVLLIVSGWLDRVSGTTTTWGGPLLRMSMLLLPAAFYEELFARGYIFTVLRDALGSWWAVAITSAFFGLAHLQNPGANAQSVILVALAGVFLAAVRIGTDSLYAAWAAHFAWNWVMAALFHTPVSGFAFEYPAYRYVDAGPDWATGGSWGPESGIPAGVLMIVGTVVCLRMSSRARARDLHLGEKNG
jgi:membrane protease YdiL (CAAX protease family)